MKRLIAFIIKIFNKLVVIIKGFNLLFVVVSVCKELVAKV